MRLDHVHRSRRRRPRQAATCWALHPSCSHSLACSIRCTDFLVSRATCEGSCASCGSVLSSLCADTAAASSSASSDCFWELLASGLSPQTHSASTGSCGSGQDGPCDTMAVFFANLRPNRPIGPSMRRSAKVLSGDPGLFLPHLPRERQPPVRKSGNVRLPSDLRLALFPSIYPLQTYNFHRSLTNLPNIRCGM